MNQLGSIKLEPMYYNCTVQERDYELVGQHKAGVQDFISAQKTNKKVLL